MAGTGSVLMLYGLAQGKFNCDHIFNLLCSYGNVLKVSAYVTNVLGGLWYCVGLRAYGDGVLYLEPTCLHFLCRFEY